MQHLYFPVWISSYSMASITQWLIKQSGCMVSIWVWNLTLKDWHIVSAGLWKQKDSLVTFCSGCAPGDDDTFRGTWKWTQINLQGEGLSILVSQALEDDCKGSQTRHLGKLLCSSCSHLPGASFLKTCLHCEIGTYWEKPKGQVWASIPPGGCILIIWTCWLGGIMETSGLQKWKGGG